MYAYVCVCVHQGSLIQFLLLATTHQTMINDIQRQITQMDYESTGHNIQQFIIDAMTKASAKGVILGLSGGVDSAVLAYLCGTNKHLRSNALAMIMPDTTITPELETNDALKLVSLTGIKYKLVDIAPIIHEYSMYVEPNNKAKANLRARVRANILYYYANSKDLLVLGSSDKSELLIGYFTKYGDGASDITPIASLYKLQTRELAKHLGVPANIIKKKSSPYLQSSDETAEGELGISYEEIDSVLYCTFDLNMKPGQIVSASISDISTIQKILKMFSDTSHKRKIPSSIEKKEDRDTLTTQVTTTQIDKTSIYKQRKK